MANTKRTANGVIQGIDRVLLPIDVPGSEENDGRETTPALDVADSMDLDDLIVIDSATPPYDACLS